MTGSAAGDIKPVGDGLLSAGPIQVQVALGVALRDRVRGDQQGEQTKQGDS